jgi:hypothetical protein
MSVISMNIPRPLISFYVTPNSVTSLNFSSNGLYL